MAQVDVQTDIPSAPEVAPDVSSDIIGRSPWEIFWRQFKRDRWAIAGMIIVGIMLLLAITAINSLKVYDIIYAMTYGGPANKTQVLSTWMYFLTYNYNSVGQGTAIAVILFLLTLIFAIPYIRMMGKN